MKQNYLFERLSLLQRNYSFELNNIWWIQKKISLGQMNICLNQINFSPKHRM